MKNYSRVLLNIFLLFLSNIRHSQQECAAYTGLLTPSTSIDSLLLCPSRFYPILGVDIVNGIRSQFCDNSTNDAIEALLMPPYVNFTSMHTFKNSLAGCIASKYLNLTTNIFDIKYEVCNPRNEIFNLHGRKCGLTSGAKMREMKHIALSQSYALENMISQFVKDYKIFNKNKRLYENVQDIINDYCYPNVADQYSKFTESLFFPKYSNGGPLFDGNVTKGRVIDPYQDAENVIDCLNKHIPEMSINNISDICGGDHRRMNATCYFTESNDILYQNMYYTFDDFQMSSKYPKLPLPEYNLTTKMYDAFEICVDSQPFLYTNRPVSVRTSGYIGNTKVSRMGELGWRIDQLRLFHDAMCMSGDENVVEEYFKCIDYPFSNSPNVFHDVFMSCVGKLNIPAFEKQSMVCYKGYVFKNGLDKIENSDLRIEIANCMKDIEMSGCISSEQSASDKTYPSTVSFVPNCFGNVTGFNVSNIEVEYPKILKNTQTIDTTFCSYRHLRHIDTFSMNFKLASQCFSLGPNNASGPDIRSDEITKCYGTVFNILKVNYDLDYILCELYDGIIRKISRCLKLDNKSGGYMKFYSNQLKFRNDCISKHRLDQKKLLEHV